MGLMERLRQLGTSKPREIDFSNIIGHDTAKDILKMAIEAEKPVHILLKGPYGIGKTELMLDVEKYVGKKNSHFSIGSRVSKAGLSDLLISNPDLEYLFIDELETMPKKDQAVLLSVQQHGIVSETLYKKTKGREKKVNVRVIATTNDTRHVLGALMTRFYTVNMNAYTEEEFVNIAKQMMLDNPHMNEEKTVMVASTIYNKAYQPTPRMVQQVANLSKGDEDKIFTAIQGLMKPKTEEVNKKK